MVRNEIDRLRALASYADQICSLADDGEDVRRRITHLINLAEEDIKTKSLEIQMQQSHIALLKQLDGFLLPPGETANRVRVNEAGNGSARAIAMDGK